MPQLQGLQDPPHDAHHPVTQNEARHYTNYENLSLQSRHAKRIEDTAFPTLDVRS